MKLQKKKITSIGILAAAALPALSLVSCGSVTPSVDEGSGFNGKYEIVYAEEVEKLYPGIIYEQANESLEDQAAWIFGRFYQAWARQKTAEELDSDPFYLNTDDSGSAILLPRATLEPHTMRSSIIKSQGDLFYKFNLAYLDDEASGIRAGTLVNGDVILHAFWKYENIPSVNPLTSETVSSLKESYASGADRGEGAFWWDTYFPKLKDYLQPDGSFIVPLSVFKDRHMIDNFSGIDYKTNRWARAGRISNYTLADKYEDMSPEKSDIFFTKRGPGVPKSIIQITYIE